MAGDRQVDTAFEFLGQSKIGDPRSIIQINQDVGGFEVPMQNAIGMRIFDGIGDGFDIGRRASWSEWSADPGRPVATGDD